MQKYSVLVLLGTFAFRGPAFGADCASLDEIDWLLGEWRTGTEEIILTESWARVSDDTFEGFGEARSAPDGGLQNRETLRMAAMSGGVFYIAKVAHNELPVAFRLSECGEDTAVFENPEHDFPNRIEYRSEGSELIATVSGANGKGFEIRYRRVAGRRQD